RTSALEVLLGPAQIAAKVVREQLPHVCEAEAAGATFAVSSTARDQRAHSERSARIASGRRCRPQLPGGPSKTPAQAVAQFGQRPPRVRFQDVIAYQSRPVSRDPQAWQ